MKLYDKVKFLLVEFPELRNSDKKLVWKVWCDEGKVDDDNYDSYGVIGYRDFMEATGYDTISRARRMVQAKCPELRSTENVRRTKKIKEASKGTFVFRETFTGQLFN